MSRWIVSTGFVSAASSAASAFAPAGLARTTLVVIAALSALLLAYFGARSEARVEEAHRRILELDAQLIETTSTADTAQQLASRPISERRMEEDYALVFKPMEDFVKRSVSNLISFVTGKSSQTNER